MKNPPDGRSQKMAVEFLDNDLDLCHTFLDTADVETGDDAAVAQARANAQRGYQTVLSLVGTIADDRERDRLTGRLLDLKTRLDQS